MNYGRCLFFIFQIEDVGKKVFLIEKTNISIKIRYLNINSKFKSLFLIRFDPNILITSSPIDQILHYNTRRKSNKKNE